MEQAVWQQMKINLQMTIIKDIFQTVKIWAYNTIVSAQLELVVSYNINLSPSIFVDQI